MTDKATEPRRDSGTVEKLVRLRIEVVGEDGDACRKLLRDLCDMIDADLSGAPGYSVSTVIGSASCEVDTISPTPTKCPHCGTGLLWSEDRGAHCDGCDDFNEETDLPNPSDVGPSARKGAS